MAGDPPKPSATRFACELRHIRSRHRLRAGPPRRASSPIRRTVGGRRARTGCSPRATRRPSAASPVSVPPGRASDAAPRGQVARWPRRAHARASASCRRASRTRLDPGRSGRGDRVRTPRGRGAPAERRRPRRRLGPRRASVPGWRRRARPSAPSPAGRSRRRRRRSAAATSSGVAAGRQRRSSTFGRGRPCPDTGWLATRVVRTSGTSRVAGPAALPLARASHRRARPVLRQADRRAFWAPATMTATRPRRDPA